MMSRFNLKSVLATSVPVTSAGLSISPPQPDLSGKLVYYLLPVRKKTVMSNLSLIFGDTLPPAEIKKLAQCFYGHLWKLAMENLTRAWMSEEEMKRRVSVEGYGHLIKAAAKNKGILLLTGHFGNWEFTPVAAMAHFKEFRGRFHILRRLLSNKFFEKILFRRFYKAGLNVIPKKKSLEQVLDALGRNDVVAFIMDQYANPQKDGVLVDFLGKKAGTFKSLALIARETGAPVIPAVCFRTGDGRHVMRFSEPLEWIEHPDTDSEIAENTRQYNRVLEGMLLEHPDQWLWAHRRWKIK